MTDADPARRTIDAYLNQVARELRGLSDAEIAEITAELKSHILERAAEHGEPTQATIEAAARSLGDARELARSYATAKIVGPIDDRRSPWRVVRTAVRLMGVSVQGFFLCVGLLIGYLLGGGMLILAALKPIFPDQIGLWTGHDSFTMGWNPGAGGQEHLGWAIIPINLVLGAAVLWATNRFGLASLRALRRRAF